MICIPYTPSDRIRPPQPAHSSSTNQPAISQGPSAVTTSVACRIPGMRTSMVSEFIIPESGAGNAFCARVLIGELAFQY